MKATELRIGNYVLLKKSKHPIQFTSFFGLCNTESHVDDFEPIPLTEEWLLKFNAVCQPWGWVLNGISDTASESEIQNKIEFEFDKWVDNNTICNIERL